MKCRGAQQNSLQIATKQYNKYKEIGIDVIEDFITEQEEQDAL